MKLSKEERSEYVLAREQTVTGIDLPEYHIVRCDDRAYAVFRDNCALFEFILILPHYFQECHVVSCGGFENAFELGRLH